DGMGHLSHMGVETYQSAFFAGIDALGLDLAAGTGELTMFEVVGADRPEESGDSPYERAMACIQRCTLTLAGLLKAIEDTGRPLRRWTVDDCRACDAAFGALSATPTLPSAQAFAPHRRSVMYLDQMIPSVHLLATAPELRGVVDWDRLRE